MNRYSISSIIIALLLLAGCGHADSTAGNPSDDNSPADSAGQMLLREVTLTVPGMNCAMCPITVRKALAGVDGVTEASASLDDKQARVVFDPEKTRVEALIAAVADAGFTATLNGDADE